MSLETSEPALIEPVANTADAIAAFSEKARSSPNDWKWRLNLGQILLRAGDCSGARQALFASYRASETLAPSDREIAQQEIACSIFSLIIECIEAKTSTQGEHIADLGARLFPKDTRILVAQAGILEMLQDWARLRKVMKQLVEIDPDNAQLNFRAALASAYAGSWHESVAQARTAWRLDPELGVISKTKPRSAILVPAFKTHVAIADARGKVFLVGLVCIISSMVAATAHWGDILWATAALVTVLTGVMAAEFGLRVKLWRVGHVAGEGLILPPTSSRVPPRFVISNMTPVNYDPVCGFRYSSIPRFHFAIVQQGRVAYAGENVLDEPALECTHARAGTDCQVLVFGDSFTKNSETRTGTNWPDFFEAAVARHTRRTIRTINHGREFFGLLQMVALAAQMTRVAVPDLIIIAYITRDLPRHRSWVHRKVVGGQERFLRTYVPGPSAPISGSFDAQVVDRRITPEWLEERSRKQDVDELLLDLTHRHNSYRMRGDHRCVDFLDIRTSLLWNSLVRGDAFERKHFSTPRERPKITDPSSYSNDKRFLQDCADLRALGARIIVVHIPAIDEILKQKEYIGTRLDMQLKNEFERLLGVPTHGLLPYLKNIPIDATTFCVDPDDDHPALLGQRAYGEAIASLVMDLQLIPMNAPEGTK